MARTRLKLKKSKVTCYLVVWSQIQKQLQKLKIVASGKWEIESRRQETLVPNKTCVIFWLFKLYSCITNFRKNKIYFFKKGISLWLFLYYIAMGFICKIKIAPLLVSFTKLHPLRWLPEHPHSSLSSFSFFSFSFSCCALLILHVAWVLCFKMLLINHSVIYPSLIPKISDPGTDHILLSLQLPWRPRLMTF